MDNFRDKTCGECAWAGRDITVTFDDLPAAIGVYCRRVNFGSLLFSSEICQTNHNLRMGLVLTTTPSCPAFVAKEAE